MGGYQLLKKNCIWYRKQPESDVLILAYRKELQY
jgi:hypothetical protein